MPKIEQEPKQHWCGTYRDLQKQLAFAEESFSNPFGARWTGGQGGTACDNEDLLAGESGFNGRSLTEQEISYLSENLIQAKENLLSHRQTCQKCVTHFQAALLWRKARGLE